jgi:hypothetical protein
VFYKVEQIDNLTNEARDTRLNGHIKYDDCKILIDGLVSEQRKQLTLWHEIVHGIAAVAEISMDEADVERFANILQCVLIDNPELREIASG